MSVETIGKASATMPANQKLVIADCDIHPSPKSVEKEIFPFLEKRWRDHYQTYGMLLRQPYQAGPAYPKGQPDAARRDAYGPNGEKPGSDLEFMRKHHLDRYNIELGVLNPLKSGQGLQNPDFAAAYCKAINDWQIAEWTSKEARLKGSVCLPYEDAILSAKEIERRAGDPNFIQAFMLIRTSEPLGNRRYWPIFNACVEANLPLAVHAFGFGGTPVTGGGWPSYYTEDMVGHSQSAQSLVTSMVMEGVFERWPELKLIIVEAGFAWAPALSWRLDRIWAQNREELLHVKRPPSEYMADNIWYTTQPFEEPDRRGHLKDIFEWIGWEKLLFATDYPHWDFDDPTRIPLPRATDEQKQSFFIDNARSLYGV
ncbi:MAG: amidohydrolase family protein [Alphaproteobacteria bacterium]